jgi:hypothetical protein
LLRGRIRRQYRRDDLEVAFADVSEGAAVGQVKIVERLAAKGAGDHLAPMTLVANRCPQFQHTLDTSEADVVLKPCLQAMRLARLKRKLLMPLT